MSVITISHQFGSGANAIGKALAEKLGYVFADSAIVTKIAKAANVSETFVEHVEEEAGGKFLWFITQMVSKGLVDKILAGERGYIDETIYLDYLVVLIAQFAEEGNVVIMGRGSQYILRDHPDAIHILMVDSLENRIQRTMKTQGLTEKKATQMVHAEDKRRAGLYKKIGKKDFENPNLYDLTINLGRVEADVAREMILSLVRERESKALD